MGGRPIGEILVDAALLFWILASVAALVYFRKTIFGGLNAAPARQGTLSVLVVCAAFLLYMMMTLGVASAAVALGYLSKADVGLSEQPAATTSKPATAPASLPPIATATATAPAITQTARAPATDPHEFAKDIVNVIPEILIVVAILAAVPWLFRQRFSGIGLHPRQLGRGVAAGLLAYLLIFPLLILVLIASQAFFEHFFQHTIQPHEVFQELEQKPSLAQTWFLYAVAALVAPFIEETIFRGFLQSTFIQFGWGFIIHQLTGLPARVVYRPSRTQRWVAIIIASILFAMLHQWDQRPVIFVLAIGLGYVYERTGILWASITLHAAFNSTMLILHGIGN